MSPPGRSQGRIGPEARSAEGSPSAPLVHVLSAGAARGLATALAPGFRETTGATIDGTFGAVGAMREKLVAGAPCDVLILTAAMLDELAGQGTVERASITPLGRVRTAVAVRKGDPKPAIGGVRELREAFAAADAFYLPDPARATAGIHCMKVIGSLGLEDALAGRLRPYPNGAAAMAALAQATSERPIGCTQATEILYTEGVELAGVLPPELELATVYAAAVVAGARDPALAGRLVAALAAPEHAALRAAGGFEP